MMHNRLHISEGNDKLGKRATANVSLLPVVTCEQGVKCAKDCYARRLAINKETIKAWMDNSAFAVNDPVLFGSALDSWIKRKKPAFFRWHVAGDIVSHEYQQVMKTVAIVNPDTLFLVMTKKGYYSWFDEEGERIRNLSALFSTWPGHELERRWREGLKLQGFNGVDWIEGDERAPKDAFQCKGTCDKCRHCWAEGWREIVLKKH